MTTPQADQPYAAPNRLDERLTSANAIWYLGIASSTFPPSDPMALNIKNDEAHRLARELADARGITLTEAVTTALVASLEDLPGFESDFLVEEIAEIQRFVAELPDRDSRTADEILGYDETGLPA